MNQPFLALLVFTLTASLSCGVDCAEKKTGMHKSSQTLKESKDNDVFQFETSCDKIKFRLDNDRSFAIKNSWVERGWLYECVNNKAVVKKDSFSQLVIEGEYTATTDSLNYLLTEINGLSGCYLGGQLSFEYSGKDPIELILKSGKNDTVIDTLKFVRKTDR